MGGLFRPHALQSSLPPPQRTHTANPSLPHATFTLSYTS